MAQAAIESSDQAAHSWALVRSERARLTDALGELGFAVMSSQSNFVLASVPAQGTAAENDQLALRLYQQLKADGILVRYFDQARLRDKLRITVGTEAQNSRLLDCLAHYLQAQKL